MLHSEGLKRTSAPDFLMSNLHVKKFWNHAKTHVEDTFQEVLVWYQAVFKPRIWCQLSWCPSRTSGVRLLYFHTTHYWHSTDHQPKGASPYAPYICNLFPTCSTDILVRRTGSLESVKEKKLFTEGLKFKTDPTYIGNNNISMRS